MTKYYKIANLIIEMDSYGRTLTQAEPYLIENYKEQDIPDIIIKTDLKSFQEKNPYYSEDDCEYMAAGGCFYHQLLNFQGMLLHSSAVVKDGQAYLFTAPSGTGKSTHTNLWLKNFEDAFILNDDKPAIRLEDGKFYAYGTPWSGKNDINRNIRAPLAGICVLHRGEKNKIEPYSGTGALHDIMEQTLRLKNPVTIGNLLDLLDKLVTMVPIWKLECNMEPEAALVSYNAMSGKENK